MLYDEQTYEVIKQRILDRINIGTSKIEGSFLDSMAGGHSEETANAYIKMGDIPNLVFIQDTFDEFLDERLSDFGVYRKLGSKTTGQIKVMGNTGEIISNGTLITANGLNFTVLNDIVLSDIDNVIYVEALEVGIKYNLSANTVFNLVESNSNITSLTNETAFTGGVDVETNEELKARFDSIMISPPTSGNKAHYEMWALECEGVGKAIVYPLWNGNGTVKVVIVGNDGKPVNAETITSVQNYIDNVKPIGCTLTVTTPTSLDVTIVSSIKLKLGYVVEDVKATFEEDLTTYVKTTTSELTYSKIYGLLVNNLGVGDISSLTINGGTSNITIPNEKIANITSITLSEVV